MCHDWAIACTLAAGSEDQKARAGWNALKGCVAYLMLGFTVTVLFTGCLLFEGGADLLASPLTDTVG